MESRRIGVKTLCRALKIPVRAQCRDAFFAQFHIPLNMGMSRIHLGAESLFVLAGTDAFGESGENVIVLIEA